METDKPNTQSMSAIERPSVPAPTTPKPKDYIPPSQADEAGMRKWKYDMLCGHPVVMLLALNSRAIHMSHSLMW